MRIKFLPIGLLCICLLISCQTGMNLSGNSESTIVENVRFDQEDDIVTIYYDLISDNEDSRYNIQLLLELDEDRFMELNSGSVTGDVGSNISPGIEKKITWDVLQDYPRGLESERIQFAINVGQYNQNKRRWLYIAGSSLLLGAGVSAAIMIGSNGGSTGLPTPPSRPGS